MNYVLGVKEKDIENRHVAIELSDLKECIYLLHPIDVLKSRLENINTLKREDLNTIRQAKASLVVLQEFISELLRRSAEEDNSKEIIKHVMQIITNLEFINRDQHAHKLTHTKYKLDLISIMKSFLQNQHLDPRWRKQTLNPAIIRAEQKITSPQHKS